MGLSVVILAAGRGTRMRSNVPKVLHLLAGKPLLTHVVDTAEQLDAERICVVYGHGGEAVRRQLSHLPVTWVEQNPQLGTGHAVLQALPHVTRDDTVLVLYGDVPLVSPATLRGLIQAVKGGAVSLITVVLDDPTGYGRILRDAQSRIVGIVEERDATSLEREIREVNTGLMAVPAAQLEAWVTKLHNNNAQGEYYLPDIVALAVREDIPVEGVSAASPCEVIGINDRCQLAQVERLYQTHQAERLMLAGVTLRDPARFDLRGELQVGCDVEIDVNVVLEGRVTLGDRVRVGANSYLRDATLGPDVVVRPNSIIEEAVIGSECIIGPFARIRPLTDLARSVQIGSFVEITRSSVGEGSHINHTSYVGDASVGKGVNIGAGAVTANYDGAIKRRTIIGDHAFIGSGTQLVAPVEVGPHATIGAGSVITHNAAPDKLTLSRARQETKPGWKRPVKKKP